MEVLIGDDGGECGFFLYIMKVGNTYEKSADGTPILPFFELGSNDPPEFADGSGKHPPFSPKSEPWQDCSSESSATAGN